MQTVTISARLNLNEAALLEEIAEIEGCDRSTLIKSVLRRGLREIRFERACEEFRKERATLSRAAQIAGLSQWDMLSAMKDEVRNIHYDVDEFQEDMKMLADL